VKQMQPTRNIAMAERRRSYSLEQAAVALQVSLRTLHRQIKSGAIRSVLASPRCRIVPADEVERILAGATTHERECA
jgi:predicted site-specific integrase-resolvase